MIRQALVTGGLVLVALLLVGAGFASSAAFTTVDGDGVSHRPYSDRTGRFYALNMPALCTVYQEAVISVGLSIVTVPASRQAGSRGVQVCLSLENAGSPKVKCLADPAGGKPVMGVTELGDVLTAAAPCAFYPVDSTHTVKCISDTASTAVDTAECVPET